MMEDKEQKVARVARQLLEVIKSGELTFDEAKQALNAAEYYLGSFKVS